MIPVLKLSEVCEKITDGTHHSPPVVQEGVPYITAKHVKEGELRFFDKPWYVSKKDHAEIYARCDPKKGDVLYIKDGATTGIAAVNEYDFPFSMLSSVALLRPIEGACDPNYLTRWLNSPIAKDGFIRRMGGAAIKRLTLAKIKQFQIPLPPLSEQKRIAWILDAADGLRAKRRAALAQLDTLLQSTFLDLFGDPVTNPKGWEMLELVEFCESKSDMKCGPFGTQLQVHEFKKEGVPLWGIRHVNSGFEKTTVEFVSKTKAKELEQYSLKAGDIVMTRKGTIGNCHVYPSTLPAGIMHSDLLRLRVSLEKCDPVFLSFQFMLSSRIKRQIALMSPGAVMPGINVSKLKRLSVENPPLDLQRRFATIVESVERQKARHREHLAQLDTLFASLQQRAFKGEL